MKKRLLCVCLAAACLMCGCGNSSTGSSGASENAGAAGNTESTGNAGSDDGTGAAGTSTTANGSGTAAAEDFCTNSAYSDEGMVTIAGEQADLDNYEVCKTSGFAYTYPESWYNLNNRYGVDLDSEDPYGYGFYYVPEEHVEALYALTDESTEDEVKEVYMAALDAEIPIFSIYRVNTDDSDSQDMEEVFTDGFEQMEMIASIGDDTFYMAYNESFNQEGLSDNDIADVQTLIDSVAEVKQNLVLFPPTEPIEDFPVDLSEFSATDMEGNTVDASVFADYDVTMINVWATWCQYCVEEMPGIEKLYESKADNVNIISICQDAAAEPELAASEIDQTGITFTVLQGNDELDEKVIENMTGFPTTFFVDSEGHLIGTLQVGVPSQGDEETIAAAYQELIDQALEDVQ